MRTLRNICTALWSFVPRRGGGTALGRIFWPSHSDSTREAHWRKRARNKHAPDIRSWAYSVEKLRKRGRRIIRLKRNHIEPGPANARRSRMGLTVEIRAVS